MVDHEAFLYGFLVVVGAAALLPAQDEAFHQLVLGHLQVEHEGHGLSAFGQHLFQGLGLGDGAWEAVEDDAFRVLEAVEHAGQDVYHQRVGDELSLVYVAFGGLAQFGAVLYLGTQHVSRRDVVDAILLYYSLALCSLA